MKKRDLIELKEKIDVVIKNFENEKCSREFVWNLFYNQKKLESYVGPILMAKPSMKKEDQKEFKEFLENQTKILSENGDPIENRLGFYSIPSDKKENVVLLLEENSKKFQRVIEVFNNLQKEWEDFINSEFEENIELKKISINLVPEKIDFETIRNLEQIIEM